MKVANLIKAPDEVNFAVKATSPKVGNGSYWLCCPMKFNGGTFVDILSTGTPYGLFSLSPAESQFV